MASSNDSKIPNEAEAKSTQREGHDNQSHPSKTTSSALPNGPTHQSPLRLLLFAFSGACVAFLLYYNLGDHLSLPRFSSSPLSGHSSAHYDAQDEPASPVPDLSTKFLRPNLPFAVPLRRPPAKAIRTADVNKRQAIKTAFMQSWHAYVEDVFGADEYHPIARTGSNFSTDGGMGFLIIDVIDALLILDEKQEYERARDWVKSLTWHDKSGRFSVFETTIRTLGGLLSAHALCTPSEDPLAARTSKLCSPGDSSLFLIKALELAQSLRPAFETNVLGLPQRDIDFKTGEIFTDKDNQDMISLAEVTTIQLEFKYLAHVSNDETWWRLAEKPMETIRRSSAASQGDGLLPIFLMPDTGMPALSDIRLGSRGDSYYEYLIKQYVQTNRTETIYLEMYQRAMAGIKTYLLRLSPKRRLLYTAEIHPRMDYRTRKPVFNLVPKQDHLVCFLGGSFMLGALHVQDSAPLQESLSHVYPPLLDNAFTRLAVEDWTIGHELTRTCVDTYVGTKTGLSPEIVMFRMENDTYQGPEKDWYVKKSTSPKTPLIDARNVQRPETVESLFIAFHLSGDPIYRKWGWQIFEAFEKYTKLDANTGGHIGAYTSIKDVNADPDKMLFEDHMETFWLAETLKYLYLLFDDQDVLRLDRWVFNTEAHPLPIFTPTFETNVI